MSSQWILRCAANREKFAWKAKNGNLIEDFVGGREAKSMNYKNRQLQKSAFEAKHGRRCCIITWEVFIIENCRR
jgi:hypothetical protein